MTPTWVLRPHSFVIDGAQLRAERKALGVYANHLAKRAGISPGYLFELENGVKQFPSAELVERLKEALAHYKQCPPAKRKLVGGINKRVATVTHIEGCELGENWKDCPACFELDGERG